MIPDDVVDRVRDEADIVQIVGEFVKLKRVGNSWRGPCPFHHGKNPNFSVSPKGGYNCFKCGEKGDVFTFVQKQLGLDFVESVKWVGGHVGIDVQDVQRRTEEKDPREKLWEVNAAAAAFFQQTLRDERAGASAREYLSARAIGAAEADRFQIGFAPRDSAVMREHLRTLGFDDARQIAAGLLVVREEQPEPRPRFRHRLMFPIFDAQGRIVGFGGRIIGEGEPKYLNSAESEIFAKRKLLYGMNWAKQSIRKSDRLFIVEGYFDAIRVMLSGIEEVVAPLGTALTEDQAVLVKKYTKNVILLYDSDEAGQKATFRAGDELLRHGISVRVVTLPEGEDPDTFAAKVGAAGVERAVEESLDVFDRKIQMLERLGWFTDLRRKRVAIDKLLPTIRATADRLLRDLYVSRTAEVAGVSREMLMEELRTSTERRVAHHRPPQDEDAPFLEDGPPPDDDAPPPTNMPQAPARRGGDRRLDYRSKANMAERELIRALLHHRRYVEAVGEEVGPSSFTDPCFRDIFTVLVAQSTDTSIEEIASLLELDSIPVLEELLAETGGLDRVDEIVTGSRAAFRQRELSLQLEDIDREMRSATPDRQDELLRTKNRIKREIDSLGRPTRYKAFQRAR